MNYTNLDIDKFAFCEMATHTAICSHPKPKNILLISDKSEALELEVKRHLNIEVESKDTNFLSEAKENSFDIVIVDENLTRVDIAHSFRVLKDDGILITKAKDYVNSAEEVKEELTNLSEFFKIVMPFRVENSKVPFNYLTFASKLYHATADIILQRAELIDDLKYYSANLQMASFELPKFLYEEIKEITKR